MNIDSPQKADRQFIGGSEPDVLALNYPSCPGPIAPCSHYQYGPRQRQYYGAAERAQAPLHMSPPRMPASSVYGTDMTRTLVAALTEALSVSEYPSQKEFSDYAAATFSAGGALHPPEAQHLS